MKTKLIAMLAASFAAVLCISAGAEEMTLTSYNGKTDMGLDSQGVLYTLDDASLTAFVGGADSLTNTSLYDGEGDGVVIIPDTVRLGEKAYSVTRIEPFAFAYNEKLTATAIPATVAEIGASAYAGCTKLLEIEVDDLSVHFAVDSGVLYSGDGLTLVCYPAGLTSESFSVADSVTAVAPGAFEGVDKLLYLDINEVTEIEEFAFANSSIKSLECPASAVKDGVFANSAIECAAFTSSSVTSLGRAAFYGCSSLKTLVLPSDVTLMEDALRDCTSLESLIFCSAGSKVIKTDALKGIPTTCKIVYADSDTSFDSFSQNADLTPSLLGGRLWRNVENMLAASSTVSYRKNGTENTAVVFTVKNASGTQKTASAYVAFYSADGRMCDVGYAEALTFGAGEIKNVTLSASKPFASYSVILLDENLAPTGLSIAQ